MHERLAALNERWRTDVAGPFHHTELLIYDELGVGFTWAHDDRGELRLVATCADGSELCGVTTWPGATLGMMLTLVLNGLVTMTLPRSA